MPNFHQRPVRHPMCKLRHATRVNDDGMSHEFVKKCGRRERFRFSIEHRALVGEVMDGDERSTAQKKRIRKWVWGSFESHFSLQPNTDRKWKAKATETITISVHCRCTAQPIHESCVVSGRRDSNGEGWSESSCGARETSGKYLNLHHDMVNGIFGLFRPIFLCFALFFSAVCLFVFSLWAGWLGCQPTEIYFFSVRLRWVLVCSLLVCQCPKFLRNLNLFCVFSLATLPQLSEWKVFIFYASCVISVMEKTNAQMGEFSHFIWIRISAFFTVCVLSLCCCSWVPPPPRACRRPSNSHFSKNINLKNKEKR